MPDIDTLLENASKKKFKKSSYRPWNYLEEIEKEQIEKQQERTVPTKIVSDIPHQNQSNINEPTDILHKEEPKLVDQPKITVQENPLATGIENSEKPISPLFSILRLSGHQKTIFTFILERCVSRGSLSSGSVNSDTLTSMTNTSLNMVNTSIQRLVDKKLIFRENSKRGRGGFYGFAISQEVYDAAIEYRRLTTLDNTDPSKINETQHENYDLPRMDNRKSVALPKEWEEIDIEPLSHISFSRGHLIQFYKQGNIDVQTLQESINHFSYDLKYNNKSASITKSSPIGYFMGIIKRTGLYNASDNYESPKDRALREMLERKKLEKEKRDGMIKELINIAFEDWQEKLTSEEKDKFIPEDIKKSRLNGAKLSSLRTYFSEHIWPHIAPKEIL